MKKRLLWLSSVIFLYFLPCVLAQQGTLEPLYWWSRTSIIDILFFKFIIAVIAGYLLYRGLTMIQFEKWPSIVFSLAFIMAVLRYMPYYLVEPFTNEGVFGAIMIVLGVLIVWFFMSRWFPLSQNKAYIGLYILVYGAIWWVFSTYAPQFMWYNPILVKMTDMFKSTYYWNYRFIWMGLGIVVLLYLFWVLTEGKRRNQQQGGNP